MNKDIKHKLLQLEDEICEHERGGARGYTLILIPCSPREPVHISVDGKPVSCDIDFAIGDAMATRAGR
ncbi:MAG: hypothetical protein ACM3O6_13205 [Acidobacteriota bacterium]